MQAEPSHEVGRARILPLSVTKRKPNPQGAKIITTQPAARRPKSIHLVIYFRNSQRFADSHLSFLALSLSLVLFGISLGVSRPLRAQARQTYSEGSGGLVQMLQRLTTTASAMHTGAHPDDEDSALIARLALGDHARVAYLSLNRGEGGQNVFGPDYYEALGVIRTEELLQARALDGGEQLFTRVVDFGYTENMAETEAKWGRDIVLGDMVRAIRLHRPLVVVSRFAGTHADGHGHHQLAGHLTPVAVEAAADPTRFPEHLEEGLRPWRVRKVYVGQGFFAAQGSEPTLRLETGVYDPALGRTYFEIAMEGRTQHKTQEMGAPRLKGPMFSNLRLVESRGDSTDSESSVFDGLDVTVEGLARLIGLPEGALGMELETMAGAARDALEQLDVRRPTEVLPLLARGLRAARRARDAVDTVSASDDARAEARFLLTHKIRQYEEALFRASGVSVDALAQRETLVPGGSTIVSVRVFVPADSQVQVGTLVVHADDGWQVVPVEEPMPAADNFFARLFREQPTAAEHVRVTAPVSARSTQPYWLHEPARGDVFHWEADGLKSVPFGPPALSGRATLVIEDLELLVEVPVQARYVDRVHGEQRRNLNIVPALSVSVTPNLGIVKLADRHVPQEITVRVENLSDGAMEGHVTLDVPSGWQLQPSQVPFTMANEGEGVTAQFTVTPAADAMVGKYRIAARAVAGGHAYVERMRLLAYPHIQPHRIYEPAALDVQVIDLQVAPVQVGYVMGVDDEVVNALRLMGVDVTLLAPTDLESGDLSRFDTIMAGIRVSEFRPDFVANIARIHNYVRSGGTLIVQEFMERRNWPYAAACAVWLIALVLLPIVGSLFSKRNQLV